MSVSILLSILMDLINKIWLNSANFSIVWSLVHEGHPTGNFNSGINEGIYAEPVLENAL